MSDKSGFEMLEDILYELETLRKEMKVMDRKISLIANSAKIAELMERVKKTDFKDFSRTTGPRAVAAEHKPRPKAQVDAPSGIKNFDFKVSDASKTQQIQPGRGKRESDKPTLVSGKMVTQINGKSTVLSGLDVKIYDHTDKLIKSTRTNKAGHWMSHLPSNKDYVVNIEGKYKGQELVPININFSVPAGAKTFEVK